MRITFVSNYINHHQMPFSQALMERKEIEYTFIQTMPMEQERIAMGWDESASGLSFVKKLWEDEEGCKRLILDSEIVIFGWTGMEELIVPRLKAGKLTFRNSERIYKDGQWKAISPRGLMQKYKDYTQYRKKPYYLLCAGGYVASDFSVIHSFSQKKFCWGYFPPCREYSEEWIRQKHYRQQRDTVKLLWAGRFIDWKHPEVALEVANALKKQGIRYELTMAGGGELEEELHRMAKEYDIDVNFTGYLEPEEIRAQMEKAQIYLFTSDYKEGWGAVCNEAMNSGCAVVVNRALGAAPFLVQHGINGLSYPNADVQMCIQHVEKLCRNSELCGQLGVKAYHTITQLWNGKYAADEFVRISKVLLDKMERGEKAPELRRLTELKGEGPMSAAAVISPRKARK